MAAMKSPFPGMDPFIEACGLWEDFHSKLIAEIERSLAPRLPAGYSVRTSERSYVVLQTSDESNGFDKGNGTGLSRHGMVPDVVVVKSSRGNGHAGQPQADEASSSVAVAEPSDQSITMRAFVEEEFRETFLEIYQLEPSRRLVTAIEVLSPSNKRPGTPGWNQFVRKRQSLLVSESNYIEIDLLRAGQRMPMNDDWPATPYYLLVSRRLRWGVCRVWPATSLEPLPEIPVPLMGSDPDVPLDLNPLIAAIYERSRYQMDIDYTDHSRGTLTAKEAHYLKAQAT
jgi:hypothetical protein